MIIEIIILLLAIPVGILIAWMTKEELKVGRKWFRQIFIFSFILSILFFVYGQNYIALTCVFIAIVSIISLLKASK